MICTGQISCEKVIVDLNNSLFALSAFINKLRSSNVIAKIISAKKLVNPLFIPNNERNIINVNSYIQVKGEIKFEEDKNCKINDKKPLNRNQGTSFFQLNSLVLNEVKQFQLINEINLSEVNLELNKIFIKFIGKTEFLRKNSNEIFTIDKIIDINEQFNYALIETKFSFANSIWNGNTAFIKINDNLYWADHHDWSENNSNNNENICNDKDLLYEKWVNPVRLIYKNTSKKNQLKLTFGFKYNPINSFNKISLEDCKILKEFDTNPIIEFSDVYVSIK